MDNISTNSEKCIAILDNNNSVQSTEYTVKHSKCICLVTDSYSAEWQCISCAVYKLAYLLIHTSVMGNFISKLWCGPVPDPDW